MLSKFDLVLHWILLFMIIRRLFKTLEGISIVSLPTHMSINLYVSDITVITLCVMAIMAFITYYGRFKLGAFLLFVSALITIIQDGREMTKFDRIFHMAFIVVAFAVLLG